MTPTLGRRVLAEYVGTAFLVAVVVGSGIAAADLSPHDVGLQLLENAAATAGGLVALILALGPVSGAHLNPAVTVGFAVAGRFPAREVLPYVAVQCAGALLASGALRFLFPDHPNLLPAFFEHEEHKLSNYVKKPLLAREGANSVIVIDGDEADRGPDQGYGEEGFVVQQYTDLGTYDGNRPVLGVWTVDMEPAGLGIRESDGLVTNNLSRFVPHVIAD